jgi:RND family efflux transporter MFP subunit
MSDEKANLEPDLSVLRMDRSGEGRRPPHGRRWPSVLALLLIAVLIAGLAVVLVPRLSWFLPEVDTVTARLVTPAEASSVLTATGYTYARERAAVGAKIIGRVERLLVDEGDRVKTGDTIAVLESDDLVAALRQRQAELLQARATQADSRRGEARFERLLEAKAISQAEYDAQSTRLEVANAQVALAEANQANARARLSYAVITAPIPGVVIERRVEVGEMVAPGGFTTQQATGAIVRIANLETLEVEADINEGYLSRLSLEQPAIIRVDAVPGREYHGRLRQIVPTADRQRAVVGVKVTVEDRDERLLPDMSVNVTFLAPDGDSAVGEARVILPADVVRVDEAGEHVLRVVEGRLRRIAVESGEVEVEDGSVVVLSGLQGGEVLVRGDTGGLGDGARVRTR